MWMLLIVLFVSPVIACQEGCSLYQGVCACDQQAEKAPDVKPSDELPPRSGMPSYQAEGVKPDMEPSLAAQDAKMDEDKTKADQEGKKAAGLPADK